MAVLAIGLSSGSCKRSIPAEKRSHSEREQPPAIVPFLGEITIIDSTAPETVPEKLKLDSESLTNTVRTLLLRGGLLPAAPATTKAAVRAVALRVRIEVSLEEVGTTTKMSARAGVRLRIGPVARVGTPAHLSEDVQAGAETFFSPKTPVAERQVLFQRLALRTVTDLIGAYQERQRLWTDDGSTIRKRLLTDAGAGDTEARLEALSAIGGRQLRAFSGDLLRMLDDPDESIRDGALGALVELREPRTVEVITRSRSLGDRRELRKILDAVSSLGGAEAVSYLEFVSTSHDDEEIRQTAKSALARLRRRDASLP